MQKLIRVLAVFPILLAGCGIQTSTPAQYDLEGVKWISPTVTTGDDSSAYLQSQYGISSQSRLLLRYEKLEDHVGKIDTTGSNKVQILAFLSDTTQSADAISNLKLCPVTRNWMMLATWQFAHPFGAGAWTAAGGDYDNDGCTAPTSTDTGSKTQLSFDMTAWYLNYPAGRGVNYGLLLINESATSSITIVGDALDTYSPRIGFVENGVIVSSGYNSPEPIPMYQKCTVSTGPSPSGSGYVSSTTCDP